MFSIKTYSDTECELEIAKTRLNLLIERKGQIYSKYFPTTSELKNIVISEIKTKDPMVDYQYEINIVDLGTGMSIEEEIIWQQNNIAKLSRCLKEMKSSLAKFKSIEYKLFYEIVCRGTSVTKAVNKISEENSLDSRSVWRNNYKKIKKDLKKIAKFSNCQ